MHYVMQCIFRAHSCGNLPGKCERGTFLKTGPAMSNTLEENVHPGIKHSLSNLSRTIELRFVAKNR